eukprot:gene9741-7616_t
MRNASLGGKAWPGLAPRTGVPQRDKLRPTVPSARGPVGPVHWANTWTEAGWKVHGEPADAIDHDADDHCSVCCRVINILRVKEFIYTSLIIQALPKVSVNANLNPALESLQAAVQRIKLGVNKLKAKNPVVRFVWAKRCKEDLNSWNQDFVEALHDFDSPDTIFSNQQTIQTTEKMASELARAEFMLKEVVRELLGKVAGEKVTMIVDNILAFLVAASRPIHHIVAFMAE